MNRTLPTDPNALRQLACLHRAQNSFLDKVSCRT